MSEGIEFGDDVFKLLHRTQDPVTGQVETTSAMPVGAKGCVVKSVVHQLQPTKEVHVATSLTFVPGAILQEPVNDDNEVVGRSIV